MTNSETCETDTEFSDQIVENPCASCSNSESTDTEYIMLIRPELIHWTKL